jgi:F420-dependent methylenetetrahydromethanopterin dehydrogenase
MGEHMKQILTEIVNMLAATTASLDAMELALVDSGVLKADTIRGRFAVHQETVESHLVLLRMKIASLKE